MPTKTDDKNAGTSTIDSTEKEYNPANQPKTLRSHTPNPELTAALSKAAGVTPTRSPDPKPKSPNTESTPSPKAKFVSPDDAPPEKPVEPQAEPQTESEVFEEPSEQPKKTEKVSQLRDAYERLKDEVSKKASDFDLTKKELDQYKAKAKSYEDKIAALELAEQRAKQLEQQVSQYDEQFRIRNYVEHPEFHQKFVKPVADAVSAAHALMAEMVIEGEDGRQATPDDFAEVLAQPNINLAARKAKELFGNDLANQVLQHRQAVITAQRQHQAAVKEAGLKSQEWAQQQNTLLSQERQKINDRLSNHLKALEEKYPTIYRPPDGDEEAANVYRQGANIADIAIQGSQDMDPEAMTEVVAKVRHRAAAFPMQLLINHRQAARIEELEAKLKEYEGSEPQAEGRKSSTGERVIGSRPDDTRAQMRAALEAKSRERTR